MLIRDLIDKAQDDWGDPEENLANLIPYGLPALDSALYGINIWDGELIAIQGDRKNRKTTLLANIILSVMKPLKELGRFMVVDTLESGETVERYRDRLISMVATYIILLKAYGQERERWQPHEVWKNEHLGLSPEFLRFRERSEAQQQAISLAMKTISDWPLDIYGPSRDREHSTDTRNLQASTKRWGELANQGAALFATDHIQQYRVGSVGDYQLQQVVVPALAQHQIDTKTAVIALSQVALGSKKDFKAGILESMHARGGTRLSEEANVVIEIVYYEEEKRVKIYTPQSRRARAKVYQYLDVTSGLFIGKAGGSDGQEL